MPNTVSDDDAYFGRSMDEQTFQSLCRIIYDYSGITLGPTKRALVMTRVGKRMRALGCPDYAAYLKKLTTENSHDEFVQLIDAVSTNVTSFFRESAHFDYLHDRLAGWASSGQSKFRIWCAAASTGEEPYTLAMTSLNAIQGKTSDIRILATDISTRALSLCVNGVYSEEKVKPVPQDLRSKYMEKVKTNGETTYSAGPALRKLLTFNRLNLSKPPFPMKGPFDCVFCRNVMIYFDRDVRSALLNDIHRLLRPGGYLFVGHCESLTNTVRGYKAVTPSVYIKVD